MSLDFKNNKEISKQKNNHFHIKLVTIGNPCSGKTCLIKRFFENYFETEYHQTVIVDYGQKVFKLNNAY